ARAVEDRAAKVFGFSRHARERCAIKRTRLFFANRDEPAPSDLCKESVRRCHDVFPFAAYECNAVDPSRIQTGTAPRSSCKDLRSAPGRKFFWLSAARTSDTPAIAWSSFHQRRRPRAVMKDAPQFGRSEPALACPPWLRAQR